MTRTVTRSKNFAASARRKRAIILHRWHRRIGVGVCVFIVWLVTSGWLLNHSATLQLAQHETRALPLLNWYGLKAEPPTQAWNSAHHWLVTDSEHLVLDGRLLAQPPLQPNGFIEANDLLFIAGRNASGASQLRILSAQGDSVDTLEGSLLPVPTIDHLGSGCAGVVIEHGEQRYTSADGTDWTACATAFNASIAAPISNAQLASVEPLLRPGITYERLLLDFHSGRILGHWGPYLIDAIGGGLMLLALSGLWLFTSQRRQRKSARTRH